MTTYSSVKRHDPKDYRSEDSAKISCPILRDATVLSLSFS